VGRALALRHDIQRQAVALEIPGEGLHSGILRFGSGNHRP
jgi:hypothetical protein